jgi:hypothetical protein
LGTELAARRISELTAPLLDQGGKLLLSYSAAEIALIVGFLTRTGELQQAHLKRMRELDPYPH